MVNFNGALLDGHSNFFNHTNRGFLFGDVLFEDFRAINAQLLFWEEHYFHLMASMRILRMEIPMRFTMEFLEDKVLNTLKSNDLVDKSASVTLGVFRNADIDLIPESNQTSYFVSTALLSSPFYVLNEENYEVELFRDYFVNQDMLSKLSTNNRTLEVVASIFAKENNYSDCLLLNTSKQVVGTLSGTLFLVKDQKVKTPPLSDGTKNTVIRKKLLEIIESLNQYEMEEASISPFELQKADELFVLSTSNGIQPITKYRKKSYGNEVAKDLLGKLNARARLASLG